MNPRLIGVLAAAVVCAIALGAVAKAVAHYKHVSAEAAAYAECKAAANGHRRSAEDLATHCDAGIAKAVLAAASAQACDTALIKGDGFGIAQTCSATVKTLLAQRDARADEVQNRDEELRRLRATNDAAIARAQARGEAQSRRRADADRAIADAPLGADGRRSCDADCLRALAGG